MIIKTRREKMHMIQAEMENLNIDVIMLLQPEMFAQLVNTSVADACLIPKSGEPIIITHPNAVSMVRQTALTNNILSYYANPIELTGKPENLYNVIKETIDNLDFEVNNIGIDEENTSYTVRKEIFGLFDRYSFVDSSLFLKKALSCKTEEEISLIRNSCKVSEEGVKAASQIIKPGIPEITVAAHAECKMREQGATGFAFGTNVNSGPRSIIFGAAASFKPIQKGEFINLDFGPIVDLYWSDICRTAIVGEPSKRQFQNYKLVHDACDFAVSLIKPGVQVKEIEKSIREFFEKNGYPSSKCWHHLGHGIGDQWGPVIALNSDDILEEGMVIAIEPGIYEEDAGGVRIEDNVVVRASGAEVLMTYPRDLIIL